VLTPPPFLLSCYVSHTQLDFKDSPDRPPTASEFLGAYCKVKGYIAAGSGVWDEHRACKDVLHDFNDGVLLFVAPPPPLSLSNASSSWIGTPDPESSEFATFQKDWLRQTELTAMRSEKVCPFLPSFLPSFLFVCLNAPLAFNRLRLVLPYEHSRPQTQLLLRSSS
jgi:hypothetical protein